MSGLYISLAELQILMDAAMGSLKISDGIGVWLFTNKQRRDIVNTLLERMGQEKLVIKGDGEG